MVMNRNSSAYRTGLLFTTALGVLALAACNKAAAPGQATAVNAVVAPPAPLPLDPNAPMSAPADAPLAAALPPAPRARVAVSRSREARYDYVNRAAGMNSGFADSPPDYAVDYQGSRPWVWRAQNGSSRVVESTPEGERYYYYDPGADRPYLVRDSHYTYGYDQGQLAVVYDVHGRPLPDGALDGQSVVAGQYLSRAIALYGALQQQRHQAAYASNWQARQAAMMRERQAWERQQQQNADWRSWNDQHAADDAWRREADARRAYLAQTPHPYAAVPLAVSPNQRPPYPVSQPRPPQTQTPANDPGARARAQQAQADAARRAQLSDQAKLADQARQQQAQAQSQAQAQAQALAASQARQAQQVQRTQAQAAQQADQARKQQAHVADQARLAEQARRVDQAQRQQAQAQAQAAAQQARAAEQARSAEQAQRQRAQGEAARQSRASAQAAVQAAAQKARLTEQAQREQARAVAAKQNDAAAQVRAAAQADRQHQAEAEAQAARAKARQTAADGAAHKPRAEHQDNGTPRNASTPQP